MNLPKIEIPFDLPIDLPVLLHPSAVHFVMAIPVVIILLELFNLAFRKRALSVFSLFLIAFVAVFMTVSYFTGVVDGKETYKALSAAGQEELREHKLLGIYLTYASWALVVLKLIFMAMSKFIWRFFFIILLVAFTWVIVVQGEDGGELTYEYGANNQLLGTSNIKSEPIPVVKEKVEVKEVVPTPEVVSTSTLEVINPEPTTDSVAQTATKTVSETIKDGAESLKEEVKSTLTTTPKE